MKPLCEVMLGICTIPHSSAACERVFSCVRKTCTDQRASLGQDTVEALLVHDTTVSAVLSAMRVYNHRAPPYASAVLVELHAIDGVHCVKIRFRNSTSLPPHDLQHPECRQACCPLDTFVKVTQDRVPVDWDRECHNPSDAPSTDRDSLMTGTILALAVVLVVLITFFVILCFGYFRQRRMAKIFEHI
ncbi:hypothetical protein ACOMHN_024299 [Nucella lapillus]